MIVIYNPSNSGRYLGAFIMPLVAIVRMINYDQLEKIAVAAGDYESLTT